MKDEARTPLVVTMRFESRDVRVGRLALDDRTVLFEYARAFVDSELTLNPMWKRPASDLVLRPKEPRLFDGLHGVFADSLPDAWGTFLLRRHLASIGTAYASTSVLDRLAFVGARGAGALVYEPAIDREDLAGAVEIDAMARDAEAVLRDETSRSFDRLWRLGGSSGGARPKILVGIDDDGNVVAGTDALPSGFSAWIVKFRAPSDVEDIGALEAAYAEMARAAGVDVADSTVLPSRTGGGYFASRRFDRVGTSGRRHMVSAAGMLDVDWSIPGVDYDTLLALTQRVTREHADVEMMFRRMLFNVAAHNRDDHAKQHAFLMNDRGVWRLAPAYDLTFSSGPGGEHYLAVNGRGRAIMRADVYAVAKRHLIAAKRADAMIDDVRRAVAAFRRHASAFGVGARTMGDVRIEIEKRAAALSA